MAKTNKRGQRLMRAAKEALAITKGEIDPAAHIARAPSDIDVKAIRERLGLTQSEFASKYRFSVARIRDWEQGRSRPDAAMRAYLMSIAAGDAAVQNSARAKGIRRVRISAQMIDAWSNTRQGQELLPVLLRRLIGRTASVTAIAMPGGDAISTTGWDGIVDAAKATPWVPEQGSFWELSAGGRPDDKAELNYQKRLQQTPAEVRAASTFVFVSGRKWSEKAQWAGSKRQSGDWKDIRAYDALDLEEWLELSPATSIWFGEQLGMSGSGLASVEEAWRIWSEQTDPPLMAGSLLMKRTEAEQKILKAVAGDQKTIAVRADSVEEAVAFICACFLRDEQRSLSARTLVVTREEGWRFVDANSEIDMVILARPELARERTPNDAVKVFIPFSVAERGAFYRGRAASAADDGSIVVDRLRPRDFEAALADIGIDQADAQRLSRLTSRSWTVFRRLRAKNDAIARPAWLEHAAARALSTVCLAGSWTGERAGDRAVVERIAGRPYDALERDLRVLATLDDAPVMAIGSVWRAKSPLELLHLMGERITREELDRFFAIAATLLTSPDPSLGLPKEDRWKAALFQKVREESGLVFSSICDSLIKLAVLGPDVDNLAVHSIATRIGALVHDLLDGADSERWLSLHSVLSELAEAAPQEFLGAIEKSLRAQEPPVVRLIRETGHSGILGGGCWHADLLRALEILAWRPQDLARVIDILVKLMKFPVAGNWINTPANTLLSLFRSWFPQTSAPLEKRISFLARVIHCDRAAGWQLLSAIALKSHDTAMSNARPKWRDDDAGAGYGATHAEINQMLAAAGARLIALAEGHAPYLATLIENLDQFDTERRTEIIALVSHYAHAENPDEDRAHLREAVREYIAWHKKYGGRAPELFAKDGPEIEGLHRDLEPKDLRARYAWLFRKTWIDLGEDRNEGYDDLSRRVEQMRVDALRKMRVAGGMKEIEYFIGEVGQPSVVGSALGGVFDNPQDAVDWIATQRTNLNPKTPTGQAMRAVMMFGLRESRAEVTKKITDMALAKWSPQELTNFYLACPSDTITWQQLERADENVQATYWAKATPHLWQNSTEELNELARRMLAANRPRTAFLATGLFMEKLEPELLHQMLDGMRLMKEDGIPFPDQWHLSCAFARLETAGILDEQELAKLEFAYVPALQFSERGLKALSRWITTNPEVFFELLKAVYKGQHDLPPAEPTEQERNFASNAWTALHNCKRFPGQRDDGSVDRSELITWAEAARKLCHEADREESGDQTIGQFLSHTGVGSDGIWPSEGVRDLLELENADHVRRGFYIGVLNNRGVSSRAYDEGGSQERELAKKFQKYAAALTDTYPRLAETIGLIQKHYELEARREDLDAKLRIEEP